MFAFIVIVLICVIVLRGGLYVVPQQHCAAIERLGRFSGIANAGLHFKIPGIDKVRIISMMTQDERMTFDAKTKDNVTIELDVSIQFRVDGSPAADITQSGVYRCIYTLTDPVGQMKDYFADALRSEIPARSLEDVFIEKEAIASSIDHSVADKMLAYGYIVVATLITAIRLPKEVQESMNRIVASKNNLESATNDANAARQKTVIAAQAEAEAMRARGEGIARQRTAIAEGIKESLDTIRDSGVTSDEANSLFMFSQWTEMMVDISKNDASTIVLPSDYDRDVFAQMLTAQKASEHGKG